MRLMQEQASDQSGVELKSSWFFLLRLFQCSSSKQAQLGPEG